eukprot:3702320-Prorocentrum_lima.AAC.1
MGVVGRGYFHWEPVAASHSPQENGGPRCQHPGALTRGCPHCGMAAGTAKGHATQWDPGTRGCPWAWNCWIAPISAAGAGVQPGDCRSPLTDV